MPFRLTFRWPHNPTEHYINTETRVDAEQLAVWHREQGAIEIEIVEVPETPREQS